MIPLATKKVYTAKNYKTVKRNMSKSINLKCIESQETNLYLFLFFLKSQEQTCISIKSSDDGAQSEEALKDFLQMGVLGIKYDDVAGLFILSQIIASSIFT